jgi:SAM-dependent methyltransferase
MEDTAEYWDERYRQGQTMPDEPADLLVENLSLLPKGGKALDVAMGSGRNALYLASRGFQVTGIDLSAVAVEKCRQKAERLGLPVEALVADLEHYPLPTEEYDLIVNFYYFQRNLTPQIVAALKPGGVLVFESFTIDQLQYGWGPKTADHLLHPGELQQMFAELETLLYHEGIVQGDRGPKAIASLIGRKRA